MDASVCFQKLILNAISISNVNSMSPSEVCTLSDKVYNHVYGYVKITDVRQILKCNNIRSDSIFDYIHHIYNTCTKCHASAPPIPASKVSVPALSRISMRLFVLNTCSWMISAYYMSWKAILDTMQPTLLKIPCYRTLHWLLKAAGLISFGILAELLETMPSIWTNL